MNFKPYFYWLLLTNRISKLEIMEGCLRANLNKLKVQTFHDFPSLKQYHTLNKSGLQNEISPKK